MKSIKLTKAAFVVLSLYLSQVQASPTDFDYCIDHSGKYILQKFISVGPGNFGKIRLIENDTRQITELSCGFDRDENKPIELSCIFSHAIGTSAHIIQVRVFRKTNPELPRIALMEIENRGKADEGIHQVIPMICNLNLKETL